ncbi:MAG: PaaI family thioesterase [Paraprevotella sp.]|nr:PaaI family thioesterase [Paraprevotella sp.]
MRKIKNPWRHKAGYFCFGCCKDNEAGVKMDFYADGDQVVCFWHPQARYQGWNDTMHGGVQAVMLDEICAWAVMRNMQTTGVTSKMETRYKRPVSTCDTYLKLVARVTGVNRNLVTIEASLFNSAGECCTQAVCTYFTFSKEKAAEMGFSGLEVEASEVTEQDAIAACEDCTG